MKKFGEFICKNKIIVLIISIILFVLSLIGMSLTKINYETYDHSCICKNKLFSW